MKAVTVSDLRKNMKRHFDEVSESGETIIVPRNNDENDAVVVMSIQEYNSWVETDYLLSSPNNRAWLLESIQQVKDGKVINFDLDAFDLDTLEV
ncbi:MAG: type II toxin-antitoxin system Phd/YefM family antitoxin [Bacteroidota bacterium]